MRSFVAIDFERDVKETLVSLQKEIKMHALSGRWKHEDNFHLTLKFLGEVETNKIKQIDDRLLKACSKFEAFSLCFSHLGCFQGQEFIRVLWLGLTGDTNALQVLQKTIEIELEDLGFASEKRDYTPHVTIAQDVVLTEDFENIKDLIKLYKIPKIQVKSVYLFKSEQKGPKRIYTPISEYKLVH